MTELFKKHGAKTYLNIDGTTVVGTICGASADNSYIKVCHDPHRTVIYRLEKGDGESSRVMLGTSNEQIGKWYVNPDQVIKISLNPDKK